MASLQLLELEQPWDGPVRVLHLLSIAKQTDVLLKALKNYATELSWSQIPAVLAEASLYQSQTPVPLRESLVCELILNVAKTHDTFNLSGQYTTSGQEAIATLQDCIFGSNLNQSPFLQLVCCQSYEKASIARLACIKLLERAATPANCFTLLHLADHCRLPSLAAAAEAVALANFAGACELDESGFLGLPMELLSSVLSSDYLVAANELQVFGAVATWVTADKPHRLPHFHKLLVTGVRLYCMSRSELYELDTHPLTPSCPEVMKAVAFAYLELCYGGAARVTAPQRRSKQPIQFHTQPVAGRAALGLEVLPNMSNNIGPPEGLNGSKYVLAFC
ncbi:hypothetical protein WJX75_004886 [Coccomyxa subellipsoidea]|uniref:BACK domain-containing protein n=1 Tax=Coccomyxa subellipsoidea TaxID=248742 RepID=A0ABR2YBH4_9CHLO